MVVICPKLIICKLFGTAWLEKVIFQIELKCFHKFHKIINFLTPVSRKPYFDLKYRYKYLIIFKKPSTVICPNFKLKNFMLSFLFYFIKLIKRKIIISVMMRRKRTPTETKRTTCFGNCKNYCQ